MSEIFEITLDELVKDKKIDFIEDDSNNTNTQKLAGLIIKLIDIANRIDESCIKNQ